MNNYLKIMGIDVWTLRGEKALILPACYCYELLKGDKRVGLLLAAAVLEEDSLTTLLHKIMGALKCQWRGQWYSAQPDAAAFTDIKFVISLGDGLDTTCFSAPIIQSHSPQALVDSPQLKAETWKTLQAVFNYIGE